MPNIIPYIVEYPVTGEEEITFRVQNMSDGNQSSTSIVLPSGEEKTIIGNGSEYLGKGKDLKDQIVFAGSHISNANPNETEIITEYYINEKPIVRHEYKKNSKRDYTDISISIEFLEGKEVLPKGKDETLYE